MTIISITKLYKNVVSLNGRNIINFISLCAETLVISTSMIHVFHCSAFSEILSFASKSCTVGYKTLTLPIGYCQDLYKECISMIVQVYYKNDVLSLRSGSRVLPAWSLVEKWFALIPFWMEKIFYLPACHRHIQLARILYETILHHVLGHCVFSCSFLTKVLFRQASKQKVIL